MARMLSRLRARGAHCTVDPARRFLSDGRSAPAPSWRPTVERDALRSARPGSCKLGPAPAN
eukprot:521883-Prorocentrum_minimum.AAC.1